MIWVAIFLSIAILASSVYFYFKKIITERIVLGIIGFAFLLLVFIPNYNALQYFKWYGFEISNYKNEVDSIKNDALKDIQNKIDIQKKIINSLIKDSNDTQKTLQSQKSLLDEVVVNAGRINNQIDSQKKELVDLNDESKKIKIDIEKSYENSKNLALLLAKITWWQQETKNQFNTTSSKKVYENIYRELNGILPILIPNSEEREKWISNLESSIAN